MLQQPTQKYNVVQHRIWLQDCLPLIENTAILEIVIQGTGDQFNDKHVLHLVS